MVSVSSNNIPMPDAKTVLTPTTEFHLHPPPFDWQLLSCSLALFNDIQRVLMYILSELLMELSLQVLNILPAPRSLKTPKL